jgi:hypothetical protein
LLISFDKESTEYILNLESIVTKIEQILEGTGIPGAAYSQEIKILCYKIIFTFMKWTVEMKSLLLTKTFENIKDRAILHLENTNNPSYQFILVKFLIEMVKDDIETKVIGKWMIDLLMTKISEVLSRNSQVESGQPKQIEYMTTNIEEKFLKLLNNLVNNLESNRLFLAWFVYEFPSETGLGRLRGKNILEKYKEAGLCSNRQKLNKLMSTIGK